MAISAVPGGAVQGAQPGGGLLGGFANDDNIGGMRMAVPVISSFQQLRAAKDAMQFSQYSRYAYEGLSGGYRGGYGMGGIGGVAGAGLRSLPGLLKSNFLISGAMSVFTNLIDLVRGKSSGTQFLANTVADTVAYTGIGASATMIGGMVGSIVPGIGTIIGMGVGALCGFLFGKLYEDKIRPGITQSLAAKFSGVGSNSGTALPPTPPGSYYQQPTNGYLAPTLPR
ncbi:MAG: hypothetical protein FJZ01_06285 [Candidatus Sericytochromatia bacterium]|nr:hypothetical protein [Candidatus Tanganyikabacteria bacterium]